MAAWGAGMVGRLGLALGGGGVVVRPGRLHVGD